MFLKTSLTIPTQMEIEKIASTLIFIHIVLGSIALISGTISIIVKKGNLVHKKSGKIFFFAMLSSILISLVIAVLPNHKSTFLFCIGLFSFYFIIGGYRSLAFKEIQTSFRVDIIIACTIIITSILMIFYPIILEHKTDTVLLVFGLIGIAFGTIDLLLFRDSKKVRSNWLEMHLSKMIGGYIAAITAFIVVNHLIPGIWGWFTPAIFGHGYLTYWLVKLKKKKTES